MKSRKIRLGCWVILLSLITAGISACGSPPISTRTEPAFIVSHTPTVNTGPSPVTQMPLKPGFTATLPVPTSYSTLATEATPTPPSFPNSSNITPTPLSPTNTIPAVPGISTEVLTALRSKLLGYNLDKDSFPIWDATARQDDLAKVGPQGYEVAERTTKGYLVLQYPAPGARMPDPSAELVAKSSAITPDESAEPDQILSKAKEVHDLGKAFVVAPTGARLERWGSETISQIAENAEVFIIQAQRWLVDDTSPGKETFISKVLAVSAAIRKANPECKIFVEVGRRADRGGGTAEQWINAMALLYQENPTSFDGIYLFITRQATDQDQGIGALQEMTSWLRK